MSELTIIPSKRKALEEGQRIKLLQPLEIGVVKIKEFEEGRVVHVPNQIKATIWFPLLAWHSQSDVRKALKLPHSLGHKEDMHGMTFSLPRESFAIMYDYRSFDEVTISEEDALSLPFFQKDDELRKPSTWFQGNERQYLYFLTKVINVIDTELAEWVKNNTESEPVTDEITENRNIPSEWEYCLTEKSQDIFNTKQQEVELAFARTTGVYVSFKGGLLSND